MDARTHAFVEHLAAAIRIKTISSEEEPPDAKEFDRLHTLFAASYPHTWATLDVEAIGRHSLLLTWHGRRPDVRGLLLLAHQDVVPVEEGSESDWAHPPFSGSTDAHHLYGRGALDDKGPLIAILETIERMIADGFTPERTVTLAFGHDEERSGRAGAAAMAKVLEARGARFRLAIDEGGAVSEGIVPGVTRPVALVATGEKGWADIELTAAGVAGHSSAPPRHTAIGKLGAAIARLERSRMPADLTHATALFGHVSSAARPGAGHLLRAATKFGPIAAKALSMRPTTNALIRTTLAPTIISGGTKANVLPTQARAVVNARILPGDTLESVVDHVRRHVGSEIDVEIVSGYPPPPVSDASSEEFKAVADTIVEVFPDAVVAPFVVIAATDARYYTAVADQVLRFVPFRVSDDEFRGIHGPNERMRLSDVPCALGFYRSLIERVCS